MEQTLIRGSEVYNYNAKSQAATDRLSDGHHGEDAALSIMNCDPITAADIHLDLKSGDTVHVIHAADGSLLTQHDEIVLTGNPLEDSRYPWTEVQKIVVYNRYQRSAKPVAGLMAPLSGYEIAFRTLLLHERVRDIGCPMKSPFITMAFMCLPVIPDIKITDRHLLDTRNMTVIR